MTTYLDELRIASFRGIEFHTRELSRDGGRRLVIEEGARQDDHSVDDMGRKARVYPLRAFLAGPAYQDARDTLIAALEAGGSSELLHPWRGILEVHVDSFSVRESTEALGTCEIDITFHEAGAADPLVIELHAPWATETASAEAIAALAAAELGVNDALEPGALPSVYRRQLEDAMLLQAASWADELGVTPDHIYAIGITFAVADIYQMLAESEDLRALLRAAMALPSAASPTVGGRHATTAHAAFQSYLVATQTAFVCRASVLAVETEWRTADEASDVLIDFADSFDRLRSTVTDEAAVALGMLHTQVSDVLTESAITARRGATVQVDDYTPAMVLSYELYGDCDREAELLRLNAQGDPATMRGLVKVLL